MVGGASAAGDEVDLDVRVDQRDRRDDHAGPQRDLEDADAVGDLLVAPLGEAPVDLVELPVDAGLDLVELLVDVAVGRLLDPAGDAAEQAAFLDVLLDARRPGGRAGRGAGGGAGRGPGGTNW